MEHFARLFKEGGADAALAASVFHNGEIKVARLKEYLAEMGIDTRI
jgi:imidazole glycerol-phosphate synthase subunit HisF